jgi:hypothetical protein
MPNSAHAMKSVGDDAARRIRMIITAVHKQIAVSRELRKTSQALRQDNADLREFLHERLLTSLSQHEHLTKE